jgi:hypothetical protein
VRVAGGEIDSVLDSVVAFGISNFKPLGSASRALVFGLTVVM